MPAADDDLSERARSRIGTLLCAKYRVDAVLGIGGMATVYAATHLRNTNRVAVKVLHRELSIDAGLRARFLREGYAANSVGHPGTVRILDDDIAEDGSIFLVMELLDGETLDARWERNRRRLPVEDVVVFTRDLLDILSAAHDKGIVHRDLKPENLFVTIDGRLRILDFGIARLREASPMRTTSRSVLGTPAYMAPEQALGRSQEVDALSDVWAVGATVFSLLAGRFVHEGKTVEEILVQAATQHASPLASVAPDVPTAIADVIDRALAFDKSDRWPSARAMQEALARALDRRDSTRSDEHREDEKTDVGFPPQRTLPIGATPSVPPRNEVTESLPTLPRASTIAGVITPSAVRRLRSRKKRKWIGVGAGVLTTVVLVGIVTAMMASPKAMPAAASGPSAASAKVVLDLENARGPTAVGPITPAETEPAVISVEALPKAAEPTTFTTAPTLRAPATALHLVEAAPLSAPTPTALPSTAASSPVRSSPRSSSSAKRDPLAPDGF